MKTLNPLCAALAAAAALTLSASAAQPHNPEATKAHGQSAAVPVTANPDEPMALRMATYPFRLGYSVVRTPLILGQTVMGKRTFINEHGFFQTRDEPTASSQQQRGRVEHTVW